MWYNCSMEIKCEQCGVKFKKPKCHIKRNKHHFCNRLCRNEWQKGFMSGEKNPRWLGDSVGYVSLHYYIKARLEKPLVCSVCGLRKELDLANKSGKYVRDVSDWLWLCRGCHNIYDKRKGKPKWIFKREGTNIIRVS